MKNLLIEMLASAVLALLIYYGLTFAGVGPRWAAAIAAGGAIAIVAIAKRVIRARRQV